MKKMLIIYYSWSDGNTKRITNMLQEKTDADIVRIDTVEPYKGSYNDVVNQGQKEVNNGYKPQIKKIDVCPAGYDVVAIGTHEMEIKFSSDGGDTLETLQNVIDKWIDGIVGFLAQERKQDYDRWRKKEFWIWLYVYAGGKRRSGYRRSN